MAEIAPILTKIRALGAEVVLERGKMRIVNGQGLNGEQRSWIAKNREAIEQHLRSASAPEPSDNDTPPLTWGQTARILYAECPDDRDPSDWSYFVTEMGKVMRSHFGIEVDA
jgi:hypothetical protein